MNKISTKYFNTIFKYINTFEEEEHHPAFGSQFETVIESFEEIKIQTKNEENLNILDLGCGLGNILFIAKQILGVNNKYVGIDNNQTYLDVGKAVDSKFHLINTDLFGKQTQQLISNADIIYIYVPLNTYEKMETLYTIISHFSKSGSYFICNDTNNQPKLSLYEKIKRFEGFDCCNKTDITIYKKK